VRFESIGIAVQASGAISTDGVFIAGDGPSEVCAAISGSKVLAITGAHRFDNFVLEN
jgi:hypothetical protein